MSVELGVLVAVLVVVVAIGLLKRWRDGRFRDAPRAGAESAEQVRPPTEPAADVLTAADLGVAPGERATLVQFSSAFCAPCRATRQVLGDVATRIPGVRHVEIDAESNLDLVRRLGVRRTPTTLVLDATGTIRTRASGAPRRSAVVAAVNDVLT